jgi:hypothetical protein
MLMERGMADYDFDAKRWMGEFPAGAAGASRARRLVLPIAPAGTIPDGLDARALARALTADPAYQLR